MDSLSGVALATPPNTNDNAIAQTLAVVSFANFRRFTYFIPFTVPCCLTAGSAAGESGLQPPLRDKKNVKLGNPLPSIVFIKISQHQ